MNSLPRDLTTLNSSQIEAMLCERLERVRLMHNLSQTQLAQRAGVSRRTISRMENGEGVSLNTFIRVMRALELADQLEELVPEASIRPIERVQRKGTERKRASSPRKPASPTDDGPWQWGDES